MQVIRPALALVLFICIAWLLSERRNAVRLRILIWGLCLQFLLAVCVLFVPGIKDAFEVVARVFVLIFEFAREGAYFLFGRLVKDEDEFGFIFAFQALPTIVFFSAISSLLFHLGVLQRIIMFFAWLMNKTMRISGREALVAAANIFVGQTEAPLLIRPYLDNLSRSELFTLMVSGMATIAGSVLAAYVAFLGGTDAASRLFFAKHLLTASVISAPAAVLIAKIMVPEYSTAHLNAADQLSVELPSNLKCKNVLDAITRGVYDGIKLAVNVGGMLIAFIALITMLNYVLSKGPGTWFGLNDLVNRLTSGAYNEFNFQVIIGFLFTPISWMLGVKTSDLILVGQLLGEKTIINEFVAYVSMAKMQTKGLLSDTYSILVAVYALCGFSNISSVGIQIGGIGALAPKRRSELAELGWKALVGSTLACLMTASIIGILSPWIKPMS